MGGGGHRSSVKVEKQGWSGVLYCFVLCVFLHACDSRQDRHLSLSSHADDSMNIQYLHLPGAFSIVCNAGTLLSQKLCLIFS